MTDLNTATQNALGFLKVGNMSNDMLSLVVLCGVGGIIFLLILLKLLFISMKRADEKRLNDFYEEIKETETP